MDVLMHATESWVATFQALFGSFYEMSYYDFKIAMLVMLLKVKYIHPQNPIRRDLNNTLIVDLEDAGIRKEKKEEEEEPATPITNEEIFQLWRMDMHDCNRASSAAHQLVNSHYLHCHNSHLLVFTVRKKNKGVTGPGPTFLVEIMSPSINEMIQRESKREACFYAIASIYDDHYINICAPGSPKTWEDVNIEGELCRANQVLAENGHLQFDPLSNHSTATNARQRATE